MNIAHSFLAVLILCGTAMAQDKPESTPEPKPEAKAAKPGFLGINFKEDGKDPGRITITMVQAGGPADKAGLKVDDVLVKIDGKTFKDGAELRKLIAAIAPGKKVVLTYVRGSEKAVETTATLIERPERPEGEELQARIMARIQELAGEGMSVEEIQAAIQEEFGVVIQLRSGGGDEDEEEEGEE